MSGIIYESNKKSIGTAKLLDNLTKLEKDNNVSNTTNEKVHNNSNLNDDDNWEHISLPCNIIIENINNKR